MIAWEHLNASISLFTFIERSYVALMGRALTFDKSVFISFFLSTIVFNQTFGLANCSDFIDQFLSVKCPLGIISVFVSTNL